MASNDHWTLDLERLGMKGAGEELARLILTCEPPYAICVQGKWGSGKTSLMRYAMARLGGEPLGTTIKTSSKAIQELPDSLQGTWGRIAQESSSYLRESLKRQASNPDHFPDSLAVRVVPIWFNPWQHQDADMPLVALLQEIRSQFTFLLQAARITEKALRIGVEAGLTILGDLADTFAVLQGGLKTSLGQIPGNILKTVERQRRRDFEELHDAQRLNLVFEEAVKRLLDLPDGPAERCPLDQEGHALVLHRLVIFVDDLDRCSEQQTVRLLEAIKLYLQTRYCVFVFGMDGAAARRAVSNVLAHKGPEEAQEYLEKLFQTTLHVPVPGNYTAFVQSLLEQSGLDQTSTGLAPQEIGDRIIRLVEPNPRKLKSFVNTLAVGWSIRENCGHEKSEFALFLLLTFLRTYHPEVYRLLAYDPRTVKDLHLVLTEGTTTSPSPIYLYFRQTFRHAFQAAFPENFESTRKDEDEVVTELIARLDRRKGDQAFQELWRQEFQDREETEVVPLVTAVLRSDQSAPKV